MAACIYNQDKIPQKFKEDTDYYHLKYTKQNGQVVVASSGWNQDGWEEILIPARLGVFLYESND